VGGEAREYGHPALECRQELEEATAVIEESLQSRPRLAPLPLTASCFR